MVENQVVDLILDQLRRIEMKIDAQVSTCAQRIQYCNQCAQDRDDKVDQKLNDIEDLVHKKADMDFVKWLVGGFAALMLVLGGFMLGVAQDVQALQKDLLYLHPGQVQKSGEVKK